MSDELSTPRDTLDELIKADEIARLLQMPQSTVEDYARRKILPSIMLGKHRRFIRSDVLVTVERLRQAGDS